MFGVKLRRKIWIVATFTIPILVMLLVDPWAAPTEEAFDTQALTALIAGMVSFVLVGCGWPMVDRQVLRRVAGRAGVNGGSGPSIHPGIIFVAAIVLAMLLLLLAQILCLRLHVRTSIVIGICVGGQQIVLTGAISILCFSRRAVRTHRVPVFFVLLTALAACWFALAVPTIVHALAERLHAAGPNYYNMLFAIPAVAVAATCFFRSARRIPR